MPRDGPVRKHRLQAPRGRSLPAQELLQQADTRARGGRRVQHRRIIDRELRGERHFGALRTARQLGTGLGTRSVGRQEVVSAQVIRALRRAAGLQVGRHAHRGAGGAPSRRSISPAWAGGRGAGHRSSQAPSASCLASSATFERHVRESLEEAPATGARAALVRQLDPLPPAADVHRGMQAPDRGARRIGLLGHATGVRVDEPAGSRRRHAPRGALEESTRALPGALLRRRPPRG